MRRTLFSISSSQELNSPSLLLKHLIHKEVLSKEGGDDGNGPCGGFYVPSSLSGSL